MVSKTAAVLLLLTTAYAFGADSAMDVVDRYLTHGFEAADPRRQVIQKEVASLLIENGRLQKDIVERASRMDVHDALLWAAAKSVAFDSQAFRNRFPALSSYANLQLISPDLFGTPRLIYQIPSGGFEPRMLFGKGDQFSGVEVGAIRNWKQPEDLSGWISDCRDYTFEQTEKGPFLVGTLIGRETTGATSIRHLLFWIRVEPQHLVWDRVEAYDVPLGQKRIAGCLKMTAVPAGP